MAKSSGYTLVTDTHDGSDGAQGADGQFERTVYQNVDNQPAFPIGGDESTAPTGWTFEPVESTSQRWKSIAPFNDGNTTLASQEISDITFSGTTAELTFLPSEAEITEIGILGTTSGDIPAAATAETTQITFAGTSATTAGVAGFSRTIDTDTFSMEEIAFGGGGTSPGWVGVGANGGIFVSTTGAGGTWTKNTAVPNSAVFLNDVAYDGDGRWIAVGNKNSSITQIWTATDPTATTEALGGWTYIGDKTDIDAVDGDEQMNAVTHDGTRWIVVGAKGIILTAINPLLDSTDTSGNQWITHSRGESDLSRRSFYGIEYVENFDGTTPLYVVVGDDLSGVKNLFWATDPTILDDGLDNGGWKANDTHGYTTDFTNVKFANDTWIITADIVGASSNVVITTDPRSTSTADWTTESVGFGSELRDAAYDGTSWYLSSSSNNYALGTYDDVNDPTSTLTWTAETTGTFTAIARGVEFADGDLVWGTQAGVLILGSAGAIPGSVLTIDGDNSQFSVAATIDLPGLSGGEVMRDAVITYINDPLNTDIVGLTASTGSNTERMNLVSDNGGSFGNMLVDIAGGTGSPTATASVSVLTEGTEVDGATNEQTNIRFTGTAGDPFAGIADRAPASLDKVQKKVGFGNQSGTDIWVAVGEREGATSDGAGTIYTATDPDGTWTRNANSPVDQAILNDVAYDGTRWIAVGDAIGGVATIITALDATGSWAQIPAGHGVTSNPQSIIYVDDLNLWVMAGLGMWTSPDGLTWTQRYSVGFYFCVEYDADNGLFVAVGNSGVMASCTDPTVVGGATGWTARTSDVSGRLRAVGYHDGQWIAVGDSGGYTASTNGTDWTGVVNGTGLTESLAGVAFAIDRWLVCGLSGNIRESTDNGANWTLGLTSPTSLALQWVSYEGDHLIIVGGADNNDGLIFTPTNSPTVFTVDGDNAEIANPIPVTMIGGSDVDSMATQLFDALNGNITGVDIYRLRDEIQINSTTTGTRTDISVSRTGGTSANAQLVIQDGSDGSGTTLSTYTLTADSTRHTPTSTITDSFDGGTDAATAIGIIRQRFIDGDIDGYTSISVVQTKTVGSDTVHYFEVTTTTTGVETDIAFGIVDGTNGTLDPNLLVTNQGVAEVSDGTQDAWTTVINQTTYTGTFGSQADGSGQASQQATQLTAMVVADPIFTAVQDTTNTNVLRITARDNGNQHNTIASLIRGTSTIGSQSTANETPPVAITDGFAIPNWTIPVQDGFRGTTGVDGARGPGRFNASVTLTDNTVHAVGSTKFNDDALAAIVTALGAGSGPTEGDVATIIYTKLDGTVYSLTGLHDGLDVTPSNWTGFALEIDGNLLVDGTIVGDKLVTGTITATQVTLNGVPNLKPQDVGAGGEANAMADNDRMVISNDRIQVFEGTTLRVVLGDLT